MNKKRMRWVKIQILYNSSLNNYKTQKVKSPFNTNKVKENSISDLNTLKSH